jgi:hypothetical protein
MLVARPILGDWMLKAIERRSPEFHSIQIPTQPLKRLNQVPYDRIRRRFGHYGVSVPYPTFLVLGVKNRRAVLFQIVS